MGGGKWWPFKITLNFAEDQVAFARVPMAIMKARPATAPPQASSDK
jgi:hypothetical protein